MQKKMNFQMLKHGETVCTVKRHTFSGIGAIQAVRALFNDFEDENDPDLLAIFQRTRGRPTALYASEEELLVNRILLLKRRGWAQSL